MCDVLRKCKKCGLEAKCEDDLELFVKDRSSLHNRRMLCKVCGSTQVCKIHAEDKSGACAAAHHRYVSKPKNQDKIRNHNYMANYGITLAIYNEMLEGQGNRCALCRTEQSSLKRRLSVDHNHETGEVRGLLCSACNKAVGMLQDSPAIMASAITYLSSEQEPDGLNTGTESRDVRYTNSKEVDRNTRLMSNFGITLQDYYSMLEAQEEKCKICEEHYSAGCKVLAVDHCHETGKVRGLLCLKCNMGIGGFRDNIETLKRALNYLQ